MKIHIVQENEEHIQGYERVVISEEGVELEKVSDNECTFILASGCLDAIKVESMEEFLIKLRQKMRMGSSISIGGTDLRVFCRAVVNGGISPQDASKVFSRNKSCSDVNYVSDLLQRLGLKINTTTISGVYYEIEASRE